VRRRLCIPLLAFVAFGLAVTGCGDDSKATETGTSSAAAEQAIASCKQKIDASALSAELKTELKKSCAQDPGGDGMASPDQMTRREACRKIVLKRMPPGPARQRGLAACAVNSRYP
jgi:hypothetical protein